MQPKHILELSRKPRRRTVDEHAEHDPTRAGPSDHRFPQIRIESLARKLGEHQALESLDVGPIATFTAREGKVIGISGVAHPMLLREFDQPLVEVLHHKVRQHRAGRRALRKDTFVLGLVIRNCRPPLRISLQSAPDELHRRQPRQFEGDKSGIAEPVEHGGDTALRYGVEEIHDVYLEQPFASTMLLRRVDRTTARVVGEARTRRFGEAKHVLRDPLLYFEQAPWRNADDSAPAPAGNALFEVYMAVPAQNPADHPPQVSVLRARQLA